MQYKIQNIFNSNKKLIQNEKSLLTLIKSVKLLYLSVTLKIKCHYNIIK